MMIKPIQIAIYLSITLCCFSPTVYCLEFSSNSISRNEESSRNEISRNEGSSENEESSQNSMRATFEDLFTHWTQAFNTRDLKGACSLFSASVKAKYRGVPEKNYDNICDGFAKIFKDKSKEYKYSYELHDIYSQGDLAAVRITWYLQIKENGHNKSIVQDEGLDILQKNDQNQWQIVNYLAYQE